jgi:putative serine protease PepD
MGIGTEVPARPVRVPPSPSAIPGRWWLAAGGAVVLAAVLGGLTGIALTRGDGNGAACQATRVAERGLPSVVTISARGQSAAAGAGTGSGEVIRAEGYVLTNDHVITPAAVGGRLDVTFDDGTTAAASIVGRDPLTDLSVLKVEGNRRLDVIPLGSSAALRVGQPVVALGAPLGLSSTVTTGVISALGRTVRVPSDVTGSALLAAAIQTDAAINPGNSGGALVDCAGRLVGVPTAGATVPDGNGGSSSGSIGIGFAIPVDAAMRIATKLIAEGSVTHADLGLRAAALAPTADRADVVVVGVRASGPADKAGLRPGDVLAAVDGTRVTDVDQLDALSVTRRPGESVTVTYRRAGTTADTSLLLGSLPSPVR